MTKLDLVTNDIYKYNRLYNKFMLALFFILGLFASNVINYNDTVLLLGFIPVVVVDVIQLFLNRKFIRLVTQNYQTVMFSIFKKYTILVFFLIPGYIIYPIFQSFIYSADKIFNYDFSIVISTIIIIFFIFTLLTNFLFNSANGLKKYVKDIISLLIVSIFAIIINSQFENQSFVTQSLAFIIPSVYTLVYAFMYIDVINKKVIRPLITLSLYILMYFVPVYYATISVIPVLKSNAFILVSIYLVCLAVIQITTIYFKKSFNIVFDKKVEKNFNYIAIFAIFCLFLYSLISAPTMLSSIVVLLITIAYIVLNYFNFKIFNVKQFDFPLKKVKEKIDVWI